MFVYNISTATMTYVAVKANQMEYTHTSLICADSVRGRNMKTDPGYLLINLYP